MFWSRCLGKKKNRYNHIISLRNISGRGGEGAQLPETPSLLALITVFQTLILLLLDG